MRRSCSALGALALSLVVPLALSACRHEDAPSGSGPGEPGRPPPVEIAGVEGTPIVPLRAQGAAIALTASDGTGLRLVSIIGRAVVEGPLAFTELMLTFENPEDRILEGRFHVALPTRATVSRFAMKVGETWQEGEVVEKKRARAAYEDFLQRKQDPALLEQGAGNEFDARVFPIPARGRKEIVLSYSEELAGEAPYAMPLAGLPEIGEVDLAVSVAGRTAATLKKKAYAPVGDFGVVRSGPPTAVRSGNLVVVPVRAIARPEADAVESAIVLVDTSASRALGFRTELDLVRDLLARLGDARVTVACFDQTTEVVYEGVARGFGAVDLARIEARGALGASNLEGALRFVKGRAQRAGARRLVVIGDGVATAGKTEPDALRAAANELASVGIARVDAVAVGGIRDEASLQRLVSAEVARSGVVADASAGVEDVARRLGERASARVAVRIEGARWSWPQTLESVQSGDETLVYADVPEGKAIRVTVGDTALGDIAVATAPRPLVERAWVKAKIGSLVEGQTDETRAAVRAEVVALSTKHRVLSPYTSLLVLETDRDYERFGIDRNALADILTIDGTRVALAHRKAPALAQPPAPDGRRAKGEDGSLSNADPHIARQAALRDAAEFGIIGLIGAGAGGDPNAPTAPWGRDDALGQDPMSARGVPIGASASNEREVRGDAPRQAPGEAQGFGSGHGRLGGAHQLSSPPSEQARRAPTSRPPVAADTKLVGAEAYTGKMKSVMDALARKSTREAFAIAAAWHDKDPGDVLALVALGEALEASGDAAGAARAYGSIIDLFSSRADLRRFAAARLERIATVPDALDLAVDSYEKAWRDRPDHPSSHHLFAMALTKRGDFARAFEVLAGALELAFPRFPGADRILREDLGLVAAAWAHAEPARRVELETRLSKAGAVLDTGASLRFVLTWETDANDVDFHVEDAAGGHAFYSHKELESGGELYADVTRGYGPECFSVKKDRSHRSSYTLKAHYYSRGPMGYGMGKVEIVDHDGKGGLKFEERPFVVMTDRAYVDLGAAK